MIYRIALAGVLFSLFLQAQPSCPETPTYSICEIVFELNDQEAQAHPNPYLSVQIHAEFRSPEARTFLMPGFWDGGRRLVIRFAPMEAGRWDYRVTSNISRWNGMIGHFTAVESDSKGFVRVANVHHFSYTEKGRRPIPHLWMGDTCYRFAFIDRALFEQIVDRRAEQKFNHIRGLVFGNFPGGEKVYLDPDTPNVAYFQELDRRVLYMNSKGITADLILGGDRNHLADFFPSWRQRQRYIRYVVARYAPMNVTWQLVQEFEEYKDGRDLMKELGGLLKKLDPYGHPRSTHTTSTSAPLLDDGWMDYIVYQTSDEALEAIEHQLYATPQVNTEFAYENSGAGATHRHHVDTDTFRKRLWIATMSGMYPTYGNTGTYGGRGIEISAEYLDAPGAQQMTHWYDFFSRTRHWELEPYYDVDGGRALALPGIEYIVYLEKPGPVELVTEKREYQIYWFNPITGEFVRPKKKKYKGERFSGQPPTLDHDWVLHLSRDGKKAAMAKRYYFESRPVLMQEVELDPKRCPYEIVEPPGETLPIDTPVRFSLKLTRETRATSRMLFLWTGEVAGAGIGYQVLATGKEGKFKVPRRLVRRLPSNMNLRVYGMNAFGKVYLLNRVYTLQEK